eukprot:scaffold310_cov335-Pavlova_lutheri.AAC.38
MFLPQVFKAPVFAFTQGPSFPSQVRVRQSDAPEQQQRDSGDGTGFVSRLCSGMVSVEGRQQDGNERPVWIDEPSAVLHEAHQPEEQGDADQEEQIGQPERMLVRPGAPRREGTRRHGPRRHRTCTLGDLPVASLEDREVCQRGRCGRHHQQHRVGDVPPRGHGVARDVSNTSE